MYSKLSMLSEQGAQAVSSAKRPQAMRKPKWSDPKQPVRSGWYSTWDGYTHDMCILTWVKNLIASRTRFASVSDLYQTSTLQRAMLQTFEVHLRWTSCTSDHVCIGRLKMVNPNLTPEGTERCAVRVSATKKQRSHQCYSRLDFGLDLAYLTLGGTRKFELPSRRLAWPQWDAWHAWHDPLVEQVVFFGMLKACEWFWVLFGQGVPRSALSKCWRVLVWWYCHGALTFKKCQCRKHQIESQECIRSHTRFR